MNTPSLQTERLTLRKFTETDFAALYAIYSDAEVNTFLPWFPVKSMEETKMFYTQRYQSVYDQPHGYAYAICRKTDNVPIGYVNLESGGAHDLGYGLRKDFWRQGIVSEAARAVLAQARLDGVPFVTATHDRNNPHSGYVMQALGMRYQYSYEEIWQPKNFPVIFRLYQLSLDGRERPAFPGYWNRYPNHFVETE